MAEILAFHLYNDFSGSPKVLHSVLNGLAEKNSYIRLYTSKNGVLDSLVSHSNIELKEVPYRFIPGSPIKTLFNLLNSNIKYFIQILRYKRKEEKPVIFINTIMPFGAAIGAKIRRFKLIYHYHENAQAKGLFYRTLSKIMQLTADKIITVSKTQAETIKRQRNVFTVPNGLPANFAKKLEYNPENAFKRRNILMLASLKAYKGINDFCLLAKKLQDFNFTLVLNSSKEECDKWITDNNLKSIPNLKIFSRSENVDRFYNAASILLNLSDKNQFIETFGLTIVEGMGAGLPAIAPTVGGPAEIVEDGKNGFKIDVQNLEELAKTISSILNSYDKYKNLSQNALKTSKKYSEERMIAEIDNLINS